MQPRARLFAASACFLAALALVASSETSASVSPSVFEDPDVGWCDEGPYGEGTAHEFGTPGACYRCAPNTCHLGTLANYCHQNHYAGTGCPGS